MSKKICLFTAHSPAAGGGGVILRSLVENLSSATIIWKYIASNAAIGYEQDYIGPGIMGGNIAKDMLLSWQMLADRSLSKINLIVNELLTIDCDAYWIVSHNEGLRIALELSRLQQVRPVHLTVHDDWEGALCERSFRYRLMAGLAKRMTISTLKKVQSFDVISDGMQDYYFKLANRKGERCHRFLKADSLNTINLNSYINRLEISVGHIGSIYSKNDFVKFLRMFYEFSILRGFKPVVHMWGCHLTVTDFSSDLRSILVFNNDKPEREVIPELAKCSFVYSMYPLSKRLRCFSKTSLPTKLTTYVQAGRPIFGHAPVDSTLAAFLRETETGVLWDSKNKKTGFEAIEKVLHLDPSFDHWKKARDTYFGDNNLSIMKKIFSS